MTTTQDLKRQYEQRRGTTSALPGLIRIAETEMWGGPKDLAVNHDKYLVSALSLEEVVASVEPLQPHKSFKEVRGEAIEEHVERVVTKMNDEDPVCFNH